MVILFSIAVLVGIVLLIYNNSKSKQVYEEELTYDGKPRNRESEFYGEGIKEFDMVGMQYQNIPKNKAGKFVGYATTEFNAYDKYAVTIYDCTHQKLGYTPKGQSRLFNSLKKLHNGKVYVWGNLEFNNISEHWNGSVNIPIGLDMAKIEELKENQRE